MKTNRNLKAILMFILPTLAIGSATFLLLLHEQERLEQRAKDDLAFKATAMAQQVRDAVLVVEADLLDALSEIPVPELLDTLAREKRVNPLVRNAFLYHTQAGLYLPNPSSPENEEERRFLSRYERLFQNTQSWSNEEDDEETVQLVATNLKNSARLKTIATTANVARGWKPWFWEDSLFLLGWSRDSEGLVRGVEIETMALFARILPILSETVDSETRLALLDSSGQTFFQSSAAEIKHNATALVRVPVGPALPHWEVLAYPDPTSIGNTTTFLAAATLSLILALAAILFSGVSLIRDAGRNRREAERKTSFVANVSHELKTPLTTVRMYAELLGQGRITDPEKQASYLRVIISESERLTRLVNNVLDFSRLEQGNKKYNMARCDLAGLIAEVMATQTPRFEKQGVVTELAPGASACYVMVDRDALEQVLLNLLDNAYKYGCCGTKKRIGVSLEPGREVHRIQVTDSGPGINRVFREKIFEKFYRIDQSLTSASQGSGIGLSIARFLITGLGGRLAYEDRDEGGACFQIELPALAGKGEKR